MSVNLILISVFIANALVSFLALKQGLLLISVATILAAFVNACLAILINVKERG